MSQTEELLDILADGAWHSIRDLHKICWRYGARLYDMRQHCPACGGGPMALVDPPPPGYNRQWRCQCGVTLGARRDANGYDEWRLAGMPQISAPRTAFPGREQAEASRRRHPSRHKALSPSGAAMRPLRGLFRQGAGKEQP